MNGYIEALKNFSNTFGRPPKPNFDSNLPKMTELRIHIFQHCRNKIWYLINSEDIPQVWKPSVYFSNGLTVTKFGSFGSSGISNLWYEAHHGILYQEVFNYLSST